MASVPVAAAPLVIPPTRGGVDQASEVEREPSPAELTDAPPADRATSLTVTPPPAERRFANTLLAVPRAIVLFLLQGPRYAAAEIDDYLEKRSPNAFARDVEKPSWRFGATVDWQTALGPSLAARVGRKFATATALDAYVGFFGARGQSGGLRASLGRYTAADLEPVLVVDAGREMRRVFAGIDDRGPRATYEDRRVAATASLAAHAGDVEFGGRGIFDASRADDANDTFLTAYDTTALVGFDEAQRAGTGELYVAYDSRRVADRSIPRGAPSTGFYARGAVSYMNGTASRTGGMSTFRGTLEARKLFDLFHGDRVLSIGGTAEAVSADAMELPFDRLPTLGGADRMRGYARDELRGRKALWADVLYEWPVGNTTRAYVFVEAGGTSSVHAGYGGGLRFVGSSTVARFQLAGSEAGDFGFYLQLGAL